MILSLELLIFELLGGGETLSDVDPLFFL